MSRVWRLGRELNERSRWVIDVNGVGQVVVEMRLWERMRVVRWVSEVRGARAERAVKALRSRFRVWIVDGSERVGGRVEMLLSEDSRVVMRGKWARI